MELLKKHLLFFLVIFVFLVALLLGLGFSIKSGIDLNDTSKALSRAERNLKRLLNANPSYVDENVAASDVNVLKLTEKLEAIREELERGEEVNASVDGVRVAAGIQQYISKFTTLALNHEGKYGPYTIEIPEDFAFGFDRFKFESEVPEDSKEISILDKQRDILDYLLGVLYSTDPKAILSVKRHSAKESGGDNINEFYNDSSIFKIGSSVTSKVEGAIETLPFEISFSGKTKTLRNFINRLIEFERPIVVRSINVSRPNETINRKLYKEAEEGQEFLTSEELEMLKEKEKTEPVVTENISDFTLVLEYIEIVLPKDLSQQENAI